MVGLEQGPGRSERKCQTNTKISAENRRRYAMQNDSILVISGNVKDVSLKVNSEIPTNLSNEASYQ